MLGGLDWKISVSRIERVRIVGPKHQYDDCLDWLTANDYKVTRSGPYTDSEMFPKVDVRRFLFEAERDRTT